jgi:hypothetical protein
LIEKAFSFATLKAEHGGMKKILREKLQMECNVAAHASGFFFARFQLPFPNSSRRGI